ncbi:hypothetical protein Poly30_24670 [Planctomycetes bacterium Poly30]|uniref:SGNH hydrolase-type esterase domain-containing protein n=1 Tax=Saltatorellus ferox TaxID=2528018 RepID=A0A518ES80_9BACT|nr:hypothetical protein Poly30_24670 [Planctomycetes bacterium Poly30]
MIRENEPTSSRPVRSHLARAGLFLALTGASAVGLALFDVIPGGWRLRTLIVPQSVQDLRRREAHRQARLEQFASETKPAPGGTLFLGSSTIERFPLAEHFGSLATVNRGIGDEDLSGLEARALSTAMDLNPAQVVLYAGSVNVRRAIDDGSWTPPGEIVVRAGRLATGLLELPGVEKVVLLGILPERETGAELADRLRETNAGLAAMAAFTDGIFFLPLAREPLIDAAGHLREEVSADRLHLNDAGYAIFAGWLQPLLEE